MKRRQILWSIAAIVLLVLIIYCIVAHNSLNIALKRAGYQTDGIRRVVELEKDSTGCLFSVFQVYSDDGKIALIYAKRDSLGFWHLSGIDDYKEEKGYASLVWSKGAGIRRFSFTDNPVFEWEWHFVYCGNNAIKEIVIEPDQIPENCAVNIQQAGEFYLIHIVTFAENPESIEIGEILTDNGCIANSAEN